MLLLPRKNGLTSLFKEVRVFTVGAVPLLAFSVSPLEKAYRSLYQVRLQARYADHELVGPNLTRLSEFCVIFSEKASCP